MSEHRSVEAQTPMTQVYSHMFTIGSTSRQGFSEVRHQVNSCSERCAFELLVWVEYAVGGFSSPLMQIGRSECGLFNLSLDAQPVSSSSIEIVLTYSDFATGRSGTANRVADRLRRLKLPVDLSDQTWRASLARVKTRLDISSDLSRIWSRNEHLKQMTQDPLDVKFERPHACNSPELLGIPGLLADRLQAL